MSRDVKTIAPSATAAEARNLMRVAGIHHLLVTDARRIVGVISDRDLGGRMGARRPENGALEVADLMTENVVSAAPDTTIRQAANLFRGRHIGSLAIVDGGKPVGIVTITDLLDLIGRGAERRIEHTQRWTLRARGARGSRPTIRHARRG